MAAPMTRQYGHGNARDFAFPERRGRLAPYRAGKRVPRVGKNVQVIEAAAADDAYFDAHDQSFVVFRERMRLRVEAMLSPYVKTPSLCPAVTKTPSEGESSSVIKRATSRERQGFRRRRIPESWGSLSPAGT